jgi:hypothetical protein
MPRYVIATLIEADVHQVADAMRSAGANIIGPVKILNYKKSSVSSGSSGRFMIECSEELATQLQKLEGVKYFEEESFYHPQNPQSR